PSYGPEPQPCSSEHLGLQLGYDDAWSSGGLVKSPNDPDVGVGVFETEIPFLVDVGLHSCITSADYQLVMSVMAGDILVPIGTMSFSVGAGEYFYDEFIYVLPSGNADQVEVVADLYYDPPPAPSPPAAVAQQGEPHDPPPLLRLRQQIVEATDRWRMELVSALPESAVSSGVEYVSTVAPTKTADAILDGLMTEEMRQSITDHIMQAGNMSPESAAEEFDRRLGLAKTDLSSAFEPVFQTIATKLFSTDRPDAEALFGASDPVDPPGMFGEALNDIHSRIQSFLDSLPSLEDYPNIKDLDVDFKFASVSDVVNADAGSSLSDYLKAANVSGLWDDLKDTDVDTFAFIEEVAVSYPIDNYGALTLSAQNVSASGVYSFKLGGSVSYARYFGGYHFNLLLVPSVLHEPDDPYEIFGDGDQVYNVDYNVIITSQ
ncbi:hypothetical protein, partial [Roseimaritima sediminicola]|uniref:hypothetical protein n=1 Tax=Roseimaritima sediminicola TaxID=2662066 RepID=UPI001F1E7CA0